MKERAIAIFFGLIMVSSVMGYAIMSLNFGSATNQQVSVPSIVMKEMTRDEKLTVWKSGKTLIQYHYPLNCTSCDGVRAELEIFARDMNASLALEEFAIQDNETAVFKMISPTGEMKDEELAGLPVNQTMLLDNFCTISYVQTKECLLRGIGTQTTPKPAIPETNGSVNATGNATGLTGNASGNVSANQTINANNTNTSNGTS